LAASAVANLFNEVPLYAAIGAVRLSEGIAS